MSDTNNYPVWPGWETVRLIGRGSFGAVYEIERDIFGDKEKAALKVIRIPQNDSDIKEMYSDGYDEESVTSTFQSYLRNIVAEYSLMRKLNGSANVVNCDDVRYVQHDDGFGWDIFIKMELLTPLSEALPPEISEEQVVRIGKDLCRALVQCRQFDIVHRDIKPQNIFISPLGDYKLGDFGIAKTIERTTGGTKIGTYKYMAPEVYNNQPYGAGADIYSLGLVLYWLLNKRRMPFLPLPPEKLRAGMEEEARLRRFNGEPLPPPIQGSEALKRIVLKACAFDPADRWQTAENMLEALESIGAPKSIYTHIPATEDEPEEATVGEYRRPRISEEKKTSSVDEVTASAPGLSSTSEAAEPRPAESTAYSGRTVEEGGTAGAFDAFAANAEDLSMDEETVSIIGNQTDAEDATQSVLPSQNAQGALSPEPKPGDNAGNYDVPVSVSDSRKESPAKPVVADPDPPKKKGKVWLWALIAVSVFALVIFLTANDLGINFGSSGTTENQSVPEEIAEPEVSLISSGECGTSCTWTLWGDGSLVIEGSGEMYDWNENLPPWYEYRDQIKSVEIRSGITRIGMFAFPDCVNVMRIEIPYGVTSIGQGALSGRMEKITLPVSITKLETQALYGCQSLRQIDIPANVKELGRNVFPSHSLMEIHVSPNNPNFCDIEGVLFTKDGKSLICYPGFKIGTAYQIPDGVGTIKSSAFNCAIHLQHVGIPKGIKNIPYDAFGGCRYLVSIDLPSSLETIDSSAFWGCESLTDVNYAGNKSKWKKIKIYEGNDCLTGATIHYGK